MDVLGEQPHSRNSGGDGDKSPHEQRKSRRAQTHAPTIYLNNVGKIMAWAS
jgi:hypothetical protein